MRKIDPKSVLDNSFHGCNTPRDGKYHTWSMIRQSIIRDTPVLYALYVSMIRWATKHRRKPCLPTQPPTQTPMCPKVKACTTTSVRLAHFMDQWLLVGGVTQLTHTSRLQ